MRFISFCRFWNVVAISLSLTAECGGGQAPAVQPIQVEGKLPARFAWLPRRLTIIFVRKAVAPSALAASPGATARAAKTSRATRSAALPLGARFIHFQIAPAYFLSIEGSHGLRSFRVVGHFDECKTTRAPSLAVHGHVNASHLAKRRKQLAQFAFRGLEAHVAHK